HLSRRHGSARAVAGRGTGRRGVGGDGGRQAVRATGGSRPFRLTLGGAACPATGCGQAGTLPAFRQEVHTRMRLVVPPTLVRTVWMFGFQRRGVRRCECEIELPKPGLLPQTS